MSKKFGDVQVGDIVYEIEGFKATKKKVCELSNRGKKTMMVKLEGRYACRVDLDNDYMHQANGYFAWFTEKEDALQFVKNNMERIEERYKYDMEHQNKLLSLIQEL